MVTSAPDAARRLARLSSQLPLSVNRAASEADDPISNPLAQISSISRASFASNPYLHPTLPEMPAELARRMSEYERAARLDLAAAYRLCHDDGLNEGVCNHLTVAMPSNSEFLVIPFGLHWGECTASRLLLVNASGKVLKGSRGATVEDTAYLIHGAMHSTLGTRARCIMHCHAPFVATLCALAPGDKSSAEFDAEWPMKQLHQVASKWYGEICYEPEHNGIVDTLNTEFANEGSRLATTFGEKKRIMFARNHGIFVIGPSVAECFDDMYYLERASRVAVQSVGIIWTQNLLRSIHRKLHDVLLQVLALSTGRPLQCITPKAARSIHNGWLATRPEYAHAHFNSRKRLLSAPSRRFDDLDTIEDESDDWEDEFF